MYILLQLLKAFSCRFCEIFIFLYKCTFIGYLFFSRKFTFKRMSLAAKKKCEDQPPDRATSTASASNASLSSGRVTSTASTSNVNLSIGGATSTSSVSSSALTTSSNSGVNFAPRNSSFVKKPINIQPKVSQVSLTSKTSSCKLNY